MRWLVGRWWFWVVAVAILFAQPLVRTLLRDPPRLPPVGPPFPVIQDLPELRSEVWGRVWIASVLDEKREILPLLGTVQNRLRNMGDSYRIVTFLDRGDPEQLARDAHANPRTWKFVRGEVKADSLAVHLIDQKGHSRGRFDPRLDSEVDDLVATLGLLVNNY